MKTIINIIIEIIKVFFTGKVSNDTKENDNQSQLEVENDSQLEKLYWQKPQESDPDWLKIAFGELNVSEILGSKHNPRIIEYHATTSLHALEDEVAWCSSFVNWCIRKANLKGTNSAMARSWLSWGGQVSLNSTLKRGGICVFKRGSNPSLGHVAFLLHDNDSHLYVLGGNQSNKVCIAKYKKSDLISIRWP